MKKDINVKIATNYPKDDTVRVYPSLSEGKGMGNLMRMFNKLIDVKNGHNMRESLVVIPFSSFPYRQEEIAVTS